MKRLNDKERKQIWICIERLQDVFMRLENVKEILEKKEWAKRNPFVAAMVHIKDTETLLREWHSLAERIERGEDVAGYVRSM